MTKTEKKLLIELYKHKKAIRKLKIEVEQLKKRPHLEAWKCVDCEVTDTKSFERPDCPDCGKQMIKVCLYDSHQIDEVFGK